MKVRFVVQGCFTGVMLMFRWYSEVFRLYSEVVCCSTTIPECSTVLPVFRILLFRWCSAIPRLFRVPLFRVLGFLILCMPSLSSMFDCSYRQIDFGIFILSLYKENTKKLSLQRKYKYIKNTMVTGIAQKSYKALFQLWSLKIKDILK